MTGLTVSTEDYVSASGPGCGSLEHHLRHRTGRREFFPTDDEPDGAYLGAAGDLQDKEAYIRNLDGLRRQTRVPFPRRSSLHQVPGSR